MITNEELVLQSIGDFELITVSSNKVYRILDRGSKYILKVNNLPPDDLSPFWLGMKEIFSSTFDSQRESIEGVLRKLSNPYVDTAELVSKSEKHKYQLFREVEGRACESDEFPDYESVEFQLGQFIGFIHKTEYDFWGTVEKQFRMDVKEKMQSTMLRIMDRYWADTDEIKGAYDRVAKCDVSPTSYSLIMPDISANQFIYAEDLRTIRAVVDFDAYVIGPREWELSVIEMCLQHGKPFREGYEQHMPFPNIKECREFYRFFMYLCDPWGKSELDLFLSRNILFEA